MKQGNLLQIWVVILLLFCATTQIVRADPNPNFVRANQDYNDGRFQEAVEGYQSLVQSGQWSANLFYNLGNAWFRLGDLGQAILNYERAVALDPHHPESAANLSLVRDEARALELKRNRLERYIATGTRTQYSIIASLAFWFILFVAARLFFLPRRSALRISLLALAILVLTGAVFALRSLETGARGRTLAIVTGKKIEARLATADNSHSVLVLPPGSEVKILSQRGDWLYAELPNELRGWIPANGAQRVRM